MAQKAPSRSGVGPKVDPLSTAGGGGGLKPSRSSQTSKPKTSAKSIDDSMSAYAQGKMSAKDLRANFKKNGYHIDTLRGKSNVIDAFRIDPKTGKPSGKAKQFEF